MQYACGYVFSFPLCILQVILCSCCSILNDIYLISLAEGSYFLHFPLLDGILNVHRNDKINLMILDDWTDTYFFANVQNVSSMTQLKSKKSLTRIDKLNICLWLKLWWTKNKSFDWIYIHIILMHHVKPFHWSSGCALCKYSCILFVLQY